MDEKDYIGSCGLYCGLCPRFQSKAKSRCLGCQLGEQHSYCSVWRCAVNKRGHLTCAECDEYPCERLIRVLGVEVGLDSCISHKPAIPNLERIRDAGLDNLLEEQRERRLLVEELLAGWNEGRSCSFFCAATALMPPDLIHKALADTGSAPAAAGNGTADIKSRAKAIRIKIKELADHAEIDIKLHKK